LRLKLKDTDGEGTCKDLKVCLAFQEGMRARLRGRRMLWCGKNWGKWECLSVLISGIYKSALLDKEMLLVMLRMKTWRIWIGDTSLKLYSTPRFHNSRTFYIICTTHQKSDLHTSYLHLYRAMKASLDYSNIFPPKPLNNPKNTS
jgi:hypothetical protein